MTDLPLELRLAHIVHEDEDLDAIPDPPYDPGVEARLRARLAVATLLSHARRAMRAAAAIVLLAIAACGGDSASPRDPGGEPRPAVATVSVASLGRTLAIGERVTVGVELRDATGRPITDRTVVWASSNPAVVRIAASGSAIGVTAGTATITATAEGRQGSTRVEVAPSAVATVEVGPAELSLAPGAQGTLQATARDAANQVVTGRPVAWSSEATGIATVAPDGRVTGVAAGDTRIVATVDGRAAAATVRVRAPGVSRLELSPAALTLEMDDAATVTATLYDAQGRVVGGQVVQWRTSDARIATIAGSVASGVVGAVQPGTATITASAAGHVATAAVTVPAHPLVADLVYLGPDPSGTGPGRIWIAPADGGPHASIPLPGIYNFATIDDLAPSPDGTRIAFTANSMDHTAGRVRMDIWVVHRDGSGLRRLTTEFESNEEQPAWSPDGTRIAYRGTRGGSDSDIWVMHADGTGQVNLTADAASDAMHEEWPAWSPDGARIAYGALVLPTGHAELWTMAPDGTGRQRLTSSVDRYDWEPAWSPDATRLAFIRAGTGMGAELHVLHVAGATPGRLEVIPIPISQLAPSWSPDGRYLAISSNHEGPFEIYTLRPDGRGLVRRTWSHAPGSYEPGWLRRP